MACSDDLVPELSAAGTELRATGPADADLVRRILAMAAYWRDDVVPAELPSAVNAYHAGWGRTGDIGVMAFRGTEFAAGAYLRQVGPADGTYGYIAGHFPELTIGTEPHFRGQGLAMLCLTALQAKAIERGIAGISLSVEPANFARRLYLKAGFELVDDRGDDLLMLWRSPATRAGKPPAI